MSQSPPCVRAAVQLAELRRFVLAEKARAGAADQPVSWERDERFLSAAESALSECHEEGLRDLLESMRGLSHYFGAYCSDLQRLDQLVDSLYSAVQEAFLERRRHRHL